MRYCSNVVGHIHYNRIGNFYFKLRPTRMICNKLQKQV